MWRVKEVECERCGGKTRNLKYCAKCTGTEGKEKVGCGKCGKMFWQWGTYKGTVCRKCYEPKNKERHGVARYKGEGRDCLKCGKRFRPEGRWNYICGRCRVTNNELDGGVGEFSSHVSGGKKD